MKNFTENEKRWLETLERKVIKHCGEMSVFSKLLEYICPHEVEKRVQHTCVIHGYMTPNKLTCTKEIREFKVM